MGGPYKIATDDVQESQRRLKRRFRIVLENFPGILYAGERVDAHRERVFNIYQRAGRRYQHLSYARWTLLDVDSRPRRPAGLLKAALGL